MRLVQAKTISRTGELAMRIPHGLILHSADCGEFRGEFFEPGFWRAKDSALPLDAGRGANWLLRRTQGDWVLRHYRRGGLVAHVATDRYVWSGHERSRSVLEWRLLRQLKELGLPVPAPVAARVRRHGLMYSADLITCYLPDTRSLAEHLRGAADRELMAATGRCIRRFHDHGLWHADLNAHNILIDADGAVFLIDFDRARFRRPGRWQNENLSRLRRSLDKLARQDGTDSLDESAWRTLCGAYYDGPGR